MVALRKGDKVIHKVLGRVMTVKGWVSELTCDQPLLEFLKIKESFAVCSWFDEDEKISRHEFLPSNILERVKIFP